MSVIRIGFPEAVQNQGAVHCGGEEHAVRAEGWF